jgi:hypothetical protein
MTDDRRPVAFDSNVLSYFLDGNRGSYALAPNDPLAPQRVAAVRLFLYCSPFIVPTVKREAAEILNLDKLEEHMGFIGSGFGEVNPDHAQRLQIERRAEALRQHHKGLNDCRIVAELEWDGGIPVLVTFDGDLQRNLRPHTRIRIETPDECWTQFDFARGHPPLWYPGRGHALEHERWWRWE